MARVWVDDARHQLPADLAAELRSARLRVGGLRYCAGLVGISPGYLSLIECGKRCPSVTVAWSLRKALNLKPALTDRLLEAAVPNAGRDWTPH